MAKRISWEEWRNSQSIIRAGLLCDGVLFFFTCCLTYFVWSVMLLFFVWLVWIVPLLHVHYWTGLESNMLWHISSCFYVVLSHIPLSAFFPTYRCTEKPFILMSWFIHKKLGFFKESIRRAIDLVSLYFI